MLKLARWLLLAAIACAPFAHAQTTSDDRLEGITTSVAVKAPVKVASTTNLTLEGEQTVNGVAVVAGDRVLVKAQSDATENGIYNVDTSEWDRAADFDGALDAVDGTLVISNADTAIYYRLTTNDPITVGSSSLTFEAVSGSVTAGSVGLLLYPRTAAEVSASVTPSSYVYAPGNFMRYGATGDGVTNDTTAVQSALNVARYGKTRPYAPNGTYLVDTLTFDTSDLTIACESRGAILQASSNIPAGGAILLSLAGGADAAGNQSLLDGIYGASVKAPRTNVTGSLENVQIRGCKFAGNGNAIRGIWATGLTRGSLIEGNYFSNFDGDAIALNGSWSFTIAYNFIEGDGTNGTGISLGRTGNGTRSSSSVVNAPTIIGNEIKSHANGVIWNFGAGGLFAGNTVESMVTDGFQSQSVAGASVTGNYFEANGGDNLQLGGTNGTDFFEGCLVSGNSLSSAAGNNIRLQGTQFCTLGPNYVTGAVTQWYFIASGIGQYVLNNRIIVPALSSTYISNAATEANAGTNEWSDQDGAPSTGRNTQNGNYTFTIVDPARVTYKASGGGGETWTIDSNANLAFPIGTVLEGCNNGGGTLTVAITSDTLNSYDDGTNLAQTGSAVVLDNTCFKVTKIDTTEWVLRGDGITAIFDVDDYLFNPANDAEFDMRRAA